MIVVDCEGMQAFAQKGTITAPRLADQTEQAWCLTVLTDAA